MYFCPQDASARRAGLALIGGVVYAGFRAELQFVGLYGLSLWPVVSSGHSHYYCVTRFPQLFMHAFIHTSYVGRNEKLTIITRDRLFMFRRK